MKPACKAAILPPPGRDGMIGFDFAEASPSDEPADTVFVSGTRSDESLRSFDGRTGM